MKVRGRWVVYSGRGRLDVRAQVIVFTDAAHPHLQWALPRSRHLQPVCISSTFGNSVYSLSVANSSVFNTWTRMEFLALAYKKVLCT